MVPIHLNISINLFHNLSNLLTSFPGTVWDILNEGQHCAKDPIQVSKSILLLTGTHMHISQSSMLPTFCTILWFAPSVLCQYCRKWFVLLSGCVWILHKKMCKGWGREMRICGGTVGSWSKEKCCSECDFESNALNRKLSEGKILVSRIISDFPSLAIICNWCSHTVLPLWSAWVLEFVIQLNS